MIGAEFFAAKLFFQKSTVAQERPMSSKPLGYRSAEKVLDSSSDEESLQSLRALSHSPSAPSRSPSPSESSSGSSVSSRSRSPTRTPSPNLESYQYIPPFTHQLSTSKDKSALPKVRSGDELFLLRIPRGLALNNLQFNFRKRKARIGEEEWKLVDDVTGDIKMLQPVEDSEKYEFSKPNVIRMLIQACYNFRGA